MAPGKIGHYEIRSLLGRGGIGEVYWAFDTELERDVAIKTLRPELSVDQAFLGRFRAEATSLAKLNHPNITTLYALFREGDTTCMVMELVRGYTLEAVLQRLGRLSVRDSLAIVIQAIMGLRYAHKMSVIHRDIKPSNLMLTEAGALKIMDFGIARIQGSQRLTRQGDVVGTLAYASPEQLRGNEGDGRSDLYSLATVLYELLSGRLPFNATSDYELIRAQVETVPPPLAPLCQDLTPDVESALMRALAKAPEERFPAVEDFGHALGATPLLADAPDIVRDGVLRPFVAQDMLATRVAAPHTTVRAERGHAASPPASSPLASPVSPRFSPPFPQPVSQPVSQPAARTGATPARQSRPSVMQAVVKTTLKTAVNPAVARAPARNRYLVPAIMAGCVLAVGGVTAFLITREPEPRRPSVAVTTPAGPRQVAVPQPAPESPMADGPVNLPPIALVPGPVRGPDSGQPATPGTIPQARPDLEGTVAQVLDSGAVIVGGKIVNLFSIVGEDGKPAKAMQRYLKSRGNRLECFAKGKAFQCFANGEDIGEHALRNGWARTREGAPAPYSAAEQEARRARVGVWAT